MAMARVHLAGACALVGVLAAAAGVEALAGLGFVLSSILLAWVVARGELGSLPGVDPARVDLRAYAASVLFVAAIFLVLGVSLWVD